MTPPPKPTPSCPWCGARGEAYPFIVRQGQSEQRKFRVLYDCTMECPTRGMPTPEAALAAALRSRELPEIRFTHEDYARVARAVAPLSEGLSLETIHHMAVFAAAEVKSLLAERAGGEER